MRPAPAGRGRTIAAGVALAFDHAVIGVHELDAAAATVAGVCSPSR